MQTTKLVRFSTQDKTSFGLVRDAGITDLSGLDPARWRELDEVLQGGELSALLAAAEAADLPVTHALEDVSIESPLARPQKIICVGVNFPDRNAEYEDGKDAPPNPSLFIRFPGSFTGHGQPLIRPAESDQLDYEGEIAIVIGKQGRRIPEADAYDHIAAVTLCNEGTLRDWVRHAKFNVTQGKNWDKSGSMGPWLVPLTDPAQISDITLTTRVNGEIRQQDRTGRMIFSFPKILNYISTFTTLLPGDIIVTGTPTGAGARFDPPKWLRPGDVIEVEADGLGTLRNTVADEA
ncbi:fumarylacetoacetate hydrolase family protein [Donghicola mangrovi]|uniref:Fumarylacetoacetate hydrolase family protein n=1 Tax=Donghicola mangrovi TaxID=2729614 RepID=A0A850QID2_9RHOB|nr:fumarylacetoacetate hydrolase family protein [Donghicola mangrovi]NVO25551.1 fumarylacetoacetate hydrolase family protein [Donghicola mangrovi]